MPDNEIYSLPDQVQWVVDKLSQAYSFLVDVFNKHLDDRDKAMNFQCKTVIDDVQGDISDRPDSLGEEVEEEEDIE